MDDTFVNEKTDLQPEQTWGQTQRTVGYGSVGRRGEWVPILPRDCAMKSFFVTAHTMRCGPDQCKRDIVRLKTEM